jgi:hypothetical protein
LASVNWLRRTRSAPPPEAPAAEVEPEGLEGPSPGVAALLEGVSEDRTHAVLDLGPASDRSLRVYSRYARWVRFADLLGEAWRPRAHGSSAGLLTTPLPTPERPYDLVFVWDILDRLFPDDRPHLVEWLAGVTAPNARHHVLVRASYDTAMRPLRFSLLDTDRIQYEPTSTAMLPPSRLLPSDIARVLAPLQVAHAFTLRAGFREYVAVRRKHDPSDRSGR